MKYARHTSVAAEKSRIEIEQTIKRYGADQFAFGESTERAMMQFRLTKPSPLVVRFNLPLTTTEKKWNVRTESYYAAAVRCGDQQIRQRWRALLLCIKAKLEAVETGIETVEHAFLAEIVLPDGKTMAEWAAPQVQAMIEKRQMPTALIEFAEKAQEA